MNSLHVLGCDAGLRSFGWAVADVTGDEVDPCDLGVIRTKKDSKLTIREDHRIRFGFIGRELAKVERAHGPFDLVCTEALVLPVGKTKLSTVAALGRAHGLVDMLAEHSHCALIVQDPQAIKKAATGKRSAAKSEVIEALDHRTGGALVDLLQSIRAKSQWEHPGDAFGAIVASLDHDVMRVARAMARGRGT